MNQKYYIKVNEIFDELSEENKRLLNELIFAKKCMKLLNELKTFIDLNFDKLKTDLDSTQRQTFEELHKDLDNVFRREPQEKSSKSDVKPIDSDIESKELTLNLKNKFNKIFGQKLLINERIVCDFIGCEEVFKTKSDLEKHSILHTNSGREFRCSFEGCVYETDLISCIKIHMKIQHSSPLGPFICGINNCGATFKKKSSLGDHRRYFHLSVKKFSCNHQNCNYKTHKKEGLNRHKLKHLSDKPFVCSIEGCAKAFKNKGSQRMHETFGHSSEYRFKCTYNGCNKLFKHPATFKAHKNSHLHSSHIQYKCSYEGCDKSFKDPSGLRTHSDFHLGKFICDWPGCGHNASSNQSLKQHMLVHSTEYNFVCHWPQCDKRFKCQMYLNKHMECHSNDKKFVCYWPGCQYRCVRRSGLAEHINHVHHGVRRKRRKLN